MKIMIDQIIRTRRKSIALIIERDGRVVVRAPVTATDEQIRMLVVKKAAWIKSKKALAAAHSPILEKKYVNGEEFLFLGKYYRLEIIKRSSRPLELKDKFLISEIFVAQAPVIFKNWYREQARQIFQERSAWYAENYGLHFAKIRITSAETRWGSCSSMGTLSFTWRLVMAPALVIDYVVVHELVHTIEKNHGKGFWAKVQNILPDYQQRAKWLKVNGNHLSIGST